MEGGVVAKGSNYMRVDPGFPGHVKAIRVGGDGIWMWLAMKAYCKVQGTDGFVPAEMIGRLAGPPPAKQTALVRLLTKAELVDPAEGGHQLHDYLDWEESADQAESRRESARQRKRDWDAKRRGVGNAVTERSRNALPNALPTRVTNTSNPVQTSTNKEEEEDAPTPAPPDTPEARLDGSGRPLPRKPAFPGMVQREDYAPCRRMAGWAGGLGLTTEQLDGVLRDLRDKHGLRPHTLDWWDERWLRFAETASKPNGPQRQASASTLTAEDFE